MKPGIPEAWTPLLQDEFAAGSFARLQQFLTGERSVQEILPCEDQVFAAFESVAPDDVRVVILGQDPYPTPGHAHGLSFSVLPGVRLPGSLRNIVRELTDDLGIPRPDHGHLAAWARQGVFLLNCVLTVEAGKPGSHRGRGWEEFTDGVLRKLSATGPRKVFLLWGNDARKKAGLIDGDRHCVLESAHPSPLSAWQGFLGSRPFSKANQALISFGREPIDWRLPPLDQPA